MRTASALLLLSLSLGACKEKAPNAEARTRAEQIWRERCAECHGARGRGDGARSATLKAKPRDFSDRAWQQSEEDDELAEIIVGGGSVEGYSAEMPPNPDLAREPEVVRELVRIIRGCAQ